MLDMCIGGHAARIRALDLDDIQNDVLYALGCEFPLLESLRIFMSPAPPSVSRPSPWGMLLRAPRLKELAVFPSLGLVDA